MRFGSKAVTWPLLPVDALQHSRARQAPAASCEAKGDPAGKRLRGEATVQYSSRAVNGSLRFVQMTANGFTLCAVFIHSSVS